MVKAGFWHPLQEGRIQCDLCPRHCQLAEGQRGFCFVRAHVQQQMVLTTYGRSSGFCVDPVEKKPLHHYLPGTPVLSFGTAGCNLACRFCQNWDISKAQHMDRLAEYAAPEAVAAAAAQSGCRSVAYTYNEPIIFLEYAVDVAKACRARGVESVAVTAGYIDPEPAVVFFGAMDAANVDLKAFSETFYYRLTGGHLQPVLELLEYLKRETKVWIELTTLLIPGENDSDAELDRLTAWVVDRLGPEVPLHFSAFHPDWKMTDKPRTPLTTVQRARQIALANGVRYAYTGNVVNPEGAITHCHQCGTPLIERIGYEVKGWRLDEKGCCAACGTPCAGRFEAKPGQWGNRRFPLRIASPQGGAS
ncbi:MAG: AmmeMemoRadiSam system radical SAM enzyme [Magnetococcales bacterium]|nr:AmmeMemoRadiSam system radical SAM enzyme [Magnetococcales bacterium]